ncbi:MAG: hypothetical protein ACREX4_12635 [Gammaproteobacteria bacterium]
MVTTSTSSGAALLPLRPKSQAPPQSISRVFKTGKAQNPMVAATEPNKKPFFNKLKFTGSETVRLA